MRKSDLAKALLVSPIMWLVEKIFIPLLTPFLSWLSRKNWTDSMGKNRISEGSIIVLPFVMAGVGFAAHQAVLTGTAIPRLDAMRIETMMIIGTAILFLLFWLMCFTLSPAVYKNHEFIADPHGERFDWMRRTATITIVLFWLGCVTWAAYKLGIRFGLVSGAVLFSLLFPGIPCLVDAMQTAGRRSIHPETKNGQAIELLFWIVVALIVGTFSLFWAR